MSESIPGPLKPFTAEIGTGWGAGVRFHWCVRIRVGNFEDESLIGAHDRCVAFSASLNVGETRLQTFLYDQAGQEIGAYYVYVDLIAARR